MFNNVKKDIRRYLLTDNETKGVTGIIELLFFNYSFWVVMSYRFGKWVREYCKIPIIKEILKLMTKVSHNIIQLFTGIQIPFEAKIGSGLYIGHTGMLVINGKAQIGNNCNIGVGVVIGQGGRDKDKSCPVIGDKVFIGVGAKVLGKIKIGNNAAIGANAVVVRDVPDNATVAGVPAKILNYSGSNDFIKT